MPKILVKEVDKSSAGQALYSNFSVVVPGLVGAGSGVGFDENGIFKCDSAAKFEEVVGCKEESAEIAAKAAMLLDIKASGETDSVYSRKLSAVEFYETYKGIVYTKEETTDPEGYLVGKIGTKKYRFTLVTSSWNSETLYSVIEKGSEGNNASVEVLTYGNKVAYELIKSGYTVYFKKFTNVSELAEASFWNCLEDKSLYDFRYITHGLIKNCDSINGYIADVAKNRGDCFALLEIDSLHYAGKAQSEAIEAIRTSGVASGNKYSAYFAPYVEYNYTSTKYTSRFPACFHYLVCAIKAQQNYAEWYAVAGYTRGVSNYVIKGVGCKLGDIAAANLQPRVMGKIAKAVNLIVTLPQGYLLWGNRTAEGLTADGLIFSHFLNVRQLCCTLKKQIYTTCRKLTYDPNSDILWANFCGAIRPLLEQMKADQGIKDYAFEKKETSLKGKLFAAVRIVPIEAVEDFEIGVTLEDSLEEPSVYVSEELVNYQE